MASPYDFKWNGKLEPEMVTSFEENGFFLARGFMDSEEVAQITKVVTNQNGILKHSYMTYEENGRQICRTLCTQPGNDVTGMVARCEKAVDTCEKLLKDEPYHWCSMFIMKEARVGGEHVWHQDYGYWYNDGCLYPNMMTMWIALDKCDKSNSCKQVLRGSHKMGRVNHGKVSSGQTGADEDRVKLMKTKCQHIYLEMDPGDAFFHHGNLMHCSGENVSDRRRWGFMSCYTVRSNPPLIETEYPAYTKLNKVPNEEIKKCRNYTNFEGKGFINRGVNNMKRKLNP